LVWPPAEWTRDGEKSYKGSARLLGHKAVITAGDSCMGRAATSVYAREGTDVAINYLTEGPDAKEVVDLVRVGGRKAIRIPGDLGCKHPFAEAAKGFGELDVMISNAGRAGRCC
jgi:NAD(P)-dependent dehydrogenase (short-subunit alcohol dehydrogenase family)